MRTITFFKFVCCSLPVVNNCIFSAERIFRNAHSSISTPTGKCPFRDAMQKQAMSSKPSAAAAPAADPQSKSSNPAKEEKNSATDCKCYTEGLQPQGEHPQP